MRSHTAYLTFNTKDKQTVKNITEQVEEEVQKSGIQEGFCLVSAMHITSSVFVNDEEPGLKQDIHDWLENHIAPWDENPGTEEDYLHNRTSEDNAAAHLRNLTIGHQVTIPITDGDLDLGPWQQLFYGEWDGQRPKRVVIKIMGMIE